MSSRLHGFLTRSNAMNGKKLKRKAFLKELKGLSSEMEFLSELRMSVIDSTAYSEETKIIASIVYEGLQTENFTGKLFPGFPEELFEQAVKFLEKKFEKY